MKVSSTGRLARFALLVLSAASLLLSGCGPGKGSISIASQPSGAKIVLNGEQKGTTPATLTGLVPGEYVVELQKDGYDRAYKTVALLDKQQLDVDVELEKTEGLLLVDSVPQGVEVLIKGVSKGKTPLLLTSLPLGTYNLEFNSPTHLPLTMSAELVDRKPVRLVAQMTSNTAKLIVSSEPSGAEIRVNGIAVGTTPATIADVVAGEVDLKVSKKGYTPFTQHMTLEATRSYRLNPELKALPAGLTVMSTPAGADVVIDNKPMGVTPLTLDNLKEGSHQLSVALHGYETASKTIYLEPDVNDSADFTLVKNSGSLMLVTEPANVQVYVDGVLRGTTEPKGGADSLSMPDEILLQYGIDHTIQLVREGYVTDTFNVSTELDQVVTRHEILKRIFVYDTRITTKTEVIKCRLEYELPNGDIYYERYPGVYNTAKKADILKVEKIDLSDESNIDARRQLEQNRQTVAPDR